MNDSLFIGSSPWFIAIASLFYGSMAVALWIANIPWWVAGPFIGLLTLDYYRVIRVHGLRTHKNAVGILCQDCDKWQYQLQSGRNCKGTLIKHKSFCSSLVIILYLQHLTESRYIVIPRDALSTKNFRHLAFKFHC